MPLVKEVRLSNKRANCQTAKSSLSFMIELAFLIMVEAMKLALIALLCTCELA